jgi:hypothetical protein
MLLFSRRIDDQALNSMQRWTIRANRTRTNIRRRGIFSR